MNPNGRDSRSSRRWKRVGHLGILPPWIQKQTGFPGEDVVNSFHREEKRCCQNTFVALDLSSKEPRSDYIWCNHAATWAYANNSGRDLDSNKIRFSYLHNIMQYSFWIGFESEKLKSLYWYSIWKRLKVTIRGPLRWSRYANTTLNHDKMTMYCALMTPQWKQSLRSLSMQVGETWSLKCSIAWLDSQNKTVPTILIITEAKYAHFFVCKRTGFVHQRLRDFVKWLCFSVSNPGFPETEIRFFVYFLLPGYF